MVFSESVMVLPGHSVVANVAVENSYNVMARNSYANVNVNFSLLQVKNCTSLTANWKGLLYSVYINTFFVLKLTLMLTFLQPAGTSPGGTEAMAYIWSACS